MKRFVTLLLAVLVALSGCSALDEPDVVEEDWENYQQPPQELQPSAPEPKEPEYPAAFTLAYHRSHTLDPVTCGDGVQETVASLLYEPLFTLNEQFQPEPVLCDNYAWNDTGLVCTLTLREGVTFSDGTALTARDVAETLLRAKESERYAYRLRNMASAAANRGGQVVITLTAPDQGLPSLLDVPIVKRTTAEWMVPVGTGPYYLDSEGGSSVLRAREDWWQGKTLPVQEIPLVTAKDWESALYLFRAGQVELITMDPTDDPSFVTGKSQAVGQPTTVLQFIGFNTAEDRFFANPSMRALFSRGIDRETLANTHLVRLAQAAQFPLQPLSPLYPKEREIPYSKEDTLAAFQNAGQASGNIRELTMLVSAGNAFRSAAARFIAEGLSLLDWNITVTELPWEEYLPALEAGEFDLYFGEVRLTADWDLTDLVGSGGLLNYGGYTNDATDQLLAQFLAAAEEDRGRAAEGLMMNLQANAPIAALCFKDYAVLTHPGVVEGLAPAPSQTFRDMEKWTIHLAPGAEMEAEPDASS